MKIRVKKIKYDLDSSKDGKKYPTSMTVEANSDFIECLYDISETDDLDLDNLDISEYIGELIEERIGEPVISFEWMFK